MPATESLSLAFTVQSLLLNLKRMISDQSIGLMLCNSGSDEKIWESNENKKKDLKLSLEICL